MSTKKGAGTEYTSVCPNGHTLHGDVSTCGRCGPGYITLETKEGGLLTVPDDDGWPTDPPGGGDPGPPAHAPH